MWFLWLVIALLSIWVALMLFVMIFLPATAIKLAVAWYGLFGMKIDRNHWWWRESTVRIMGVVLTALFVSALLCVAARG